MTAIRRVTQKLLSQLQGEGVGAKVRRSIGRPELKNFDPFLMLDEFYVDHPAGFPDHPHRGFETVTYMLNGKMGHQDFAGNKGIIGPGDLQWMTAGKGILHCEMPASKETAHGLQLWVNLSSKEKMIEPAYQDLLDKDIPRVTEGGVHAKVIAGQLLGVSSPVKTRTPTMYIDIKIEPNTTFVHAIPTEYNAFLYTIEGEALFGDADSHSGPHTTILLGKGDSFKVQTLEKAVHFVLIAGKPLNEPVVQYGPFVMNSQEQIMEAMRDYQMARNGFENARKWQSDEIKLE